MVVGDIDDDDSTASGGDDPTEGWSQPAPKKYPVEDLLADP
jgi:hypothetical protein